MIYLDTMEIAVNNPPVVNRRLFCRLLSTIDFQGNCRLASAKKEICRHESTNFGQFVYIWDILVPYEMSAAGENFAVSERY